MNDIPGAAYPRVFDPAAIAAMQGKTITMKVDPAMERLAVLLVVNCFRNTVLENYHTDWPEFTQAKMKALMKEAVSKIHTALHAFFTGDEATQSAAWEVLNVYFPPQWDKPEFDQGLLRTIELTKQARKREGTSVRDDSHKPHRRRSTQPKD